MEDTTPKGIQEFADELEKMSLALIQCKSAYESMKKDRDKLKELLVMSANYGYDYHKNTQFPEMSFEDNCKNNYLQFLESIASK